MTTKDNGTSLQPVFPDKDLNEKLLQYMQGIWDSTAEYKVMLTDRMLNLNYVFIDKYEAYKNEEYSTENILAGQALLQYAGDMAAIYARRGRIPSIMICTDVLFHGRDIIKLLNDLKKLITQYLQAWSLKTNSYSLEQSLRDAVTIYAFARSKDSGLLINTEQHRIYSANFVSMDRMRNMSLHISEYLLQCGKSNSSHLLSVHLPGYRVKEILASDRCKNAFRYREEAQFLYIRKRSPNIIENIRLSCLDSGSDHDGFLTGTVIFGNMQKDRFEQLCEKVAKLMEKHAQEYRIQISQIAEDLRSHTQELISYRARLITFLYSVFSMADFCRQYLKIDELDLYNILYSDRISRIISVFHMNRYSANEAIFQNELHILFKKICLNEIALSSFWNALDSAVQDPVPGTQTDQFVHSRDFGIIWGPIMIDKANELAEDIFCEISMDSEYGAFKYIRTGLPFDVNKDRFDSLSLTRYLNIMMRCEHTWKVSLGCAFGLIDHGMCSMDIKLNTEAEKPVLQTVLKTEEPALCILPERYSIFIPAIAFIETHYQKVGKYVRDVVGAFIDHLQGHCYADEDNSGSGDKRMMQMLQKQKLLLLYIYSCGHLFQEWDIGLNWKLFTPEEEQIRKDYYVKVAEQFIETAKYS